MEEPVNQQPDLQPAPVKAAPAEGAGVSAEEPKGPSKAGPSTAGAPGTPTARAGAPGANVGGQEALAPLTSGRGRAGTADMLYGALSVSCLAMSLICLLIPDLAAKALFGRSADPLEEQHRQLMQLNGGALLMATAATATLALGPGRGGLAAASTDLLKLALAGQGLANTLLFVYYLRSINPLAWPLEMATNGAMLALPAFHLSSRGNVRGLAGELLRRLQVRVNSLAVRRGSMLAGSYHLLALLFPAAGFSLFYAPKYTLYHLFGYAYGSSTFLLGKVAGVADKSLMPIALLTLKEAAEKGELGSRGARTLNAGVLLAGLVHMAVLMPINAVGPGGWMLPGVTGAWILATLAAAAGLAVGMGWRPDRRAAAAAEGIVGESAGKQE